MIRVLAVLALASLAGCAPTEDHFQIRGDASDEEAAVMQAGADAWCEATGGAWCAAIDRGEARNVIAIVPVGELLDKDWALHTRHDDAQKWHEIRITGHRENETWLFDLRALTIHELGHAYGLGHIEGTVMQLGYEREMFDPHYRRS